VYVEKDEIRHDGLHQLCACSKQSIIFDVYATMKHNPFQPIHGAETLLIATEVPSTGAFVT